MTQLGKNVLFWITTRMFSLWEEQFCSQLCKHGLQNWKCKACFDFVQVILENLPSQICKTMIKIILKGRCVSKPHIKASNCSVIPFKPKMFDGSELLSYFNGICCNQADFCSALFRHSHFLIQNLHLHPIKYMLLDCMPKSNSEFLQRQPREKTVGSGGDITEPLFLTSQNIVPSRTWHLWRKDLYFLT